MLAGTRQPWITRRLAGRQRLARMCPRYRLFLRVVTTQPALEEAARLSGLHPSRLSPRVPSHAPVATTTRERLANPPARQCATTRARRTGLPWTRLILIDSPRPPRARLHPAKAQTFHHGQGAVIGHPWTHIVVLLGDRRLPLQPMPFARQRSGQTPGLAAHSAPERVVASRRPLDLEDSLGADAPRAVLGLAESGSDNKKSEQAIAANGGHGILALGKPRSVTSAALSLTTPPARPWCPIDTLFRRPRRLTWPPMRLATHGNTRQRMAVRVRHPAGSVRSVGQVEWVGADRRNRPDGRRTSRAGHALRATARQMGRGYRRRWARALVHQSVKQHLGCAEGATHGGDAGISHVHWG